MEGGVGLGLRVGVAWTGGGRGFGVGGAWTVGGRGLGRGLEGPPLITVESFTIGHLPDCWFQVCVVPPSPEDSVPCSLHLGLKLTAPGWFFLLLIL